MAQPHGFLHSVAHALASMSLYAGGHPARQKVVDSAWRQLEELRSENDTPRFTFLERAVVYGNRALHDMEQWPWAKRLSDMGVQRLELDGAVTRESFGLFLEDVLLRLAEKGEKLGPPQARDGIRFGAVRLSGEDIAIAGENQAPTASLAYKLSEETEVVRWLYQQAEGNALPLDEAEAVVRSLTVAMRADGELLIPLIQLSEQDEYAAIHAINVSVLTMTLAEGLGMAPRDVRAFGVAGLLHDIGMTQVPKDLLHKGPLSPEERSLMQRHPLDGARLLLRQGDELEIAAVAAYEHHARPDGSGYPRLRYARDFHHASKIISVCDAYDALRTPRSFRPAWDAEKALAYIESGAGTIFDAAMAQTFVSSMRKLEERVRLVGPGVNKALPAGVGTGVTFTLEHRSAVEAPPDA